MDHPLGEKNGTDAVRHADNMKNGGDWFRFLEIATGWAVITPWYMHEVTGIHKGRRMADCTRIIQRCELLALVGPTVNPHSEHNQRVAQRAGIPVLDLTDLGTEPPELTKGVKQLISTRAAKVIEAAPRRGWMPSLTSEQLDTLKKLRRTAHSMGGPGEFDKSVALLDRFVACYEAYKRSS